MVCCPDAIVIHFNGNNVSVQECRYFSDNEQTPYPPLKQTIVVEPLRAQWALQPNIFIYMIFYILPYKIIMIFLNLNAYIPLLFYLTLQSYNEMKFYPETNN